MKTGDKNFSWKIGLIFGVGSMVIVAIGLLLTQGASAVEQVSDSSGIPIFYGDRSLSPNLKAGTVTITSPKNPVQLGEKFRLEGIISPDLPTNVLGKVACAFPEWNEGLKQVDGCATPYKDVNTGQTNSSFSIEIEAPSTSGTYRIGLYLERSVPAYYAHRQMFEGHVYINVAGNTPVVVHKKPKVQLYVGTVGNCRTATEVSILPGEKATLCWKVEEE